MFRSSNNGRCPRCNGHGTLCVRIERADGRWVRYEPDIVCDLCEGKPPMTAARAAQELTKQVV